MGHKKEQSVVSELPYAAIVGLVIALAIAYLVFNYTPLFAQTSHLSYVRSMASSTAASTTPLSTIAPLNRADYLARLYALAHRAEPTAASSTTATSSPQSASSTKNYLWPVKPIVYPLAGALLPFNRIVSYYGNFYSAGMGVLGEYPEGQVLQMLASTTAQWKRADPTTPVIPAIEYIAVTAQGSAGADGKYRLRMPDSQIDKAIDMASQANGIVILDVQVGLSNVQTEVPLLQKYLSMPQVELAVDPEFDMHGSEAPGTVIGTMSASDINWTINYLAQLVQQNNLPPKILVIHRFTEDMVTGYKNIAPVPEVQVVMDMDGWGGQQKKIGSYTYFVEDEPVEFAGMKLFYKNDLRPPSTGMLTPAQVLNLTPAPIFIQYE